MFMRAMLCLAVLLSLSVSVEGDTFTWQGKLVDGVTDANGTYDFKFRLYDAAAGPSQVGGEIVVDDVVVSDGLLTVDLDFGPGIFLGADRWLEIDVRFEGRLNTEISFELDNP